MKNIYLGALGLVTVLILYIHPMEVIGILSPDRYPPSDVAVVEYRLTGAVNKDWTPIDVSKATSSPGFNLKLTEPGITHVFVSAKDKAGNVSMQMGAFQVGDDGTSSPSPIKNIRYKLTGATTQDMTEYKEPFKIVNEGITTIYVTAEDMSGNQVSLTRVVKVDKSSPINNGVTITLD